MLLMNEFKIIVDIIEERIYWLKAEIVTLRNKLKSDSLVKHEYEFLENVATKIYNFAYYLGEVNHALKTNDYDIY